jgi:hypothetical protein
MPIRKTRVKNVSATLEIKSEAIGLPNSVKGDKRIKQQHEDAKELILLFIRPFMPH